MNVENVSRAQWKEIRDRIKKGGIQEVKALCSSIVNGTKDTYYKSGYEHGYKTGVSNGVDTAKTSILQVVDTTLHKEFGIGPERLARFHKRFIQEVQSTMNNDSPDQEDAQQKIITEEDKERYMILVSMTEFINMTRRIDSSILVNQSARFELDNVYDQLIHITSSIRKSIGAEDDNAIMEQLKTMSLYLAPTVLPGDADEQ